MRWGHLLWFSFFNWEETTQYIRVQTFSGAIRIRTERDWTKFSGIETSCRVLNALTFSRTPFCSIFGSQQQLKSFLFGFFVKPARIEFVLHSTASAVCGSFNKCCLEQQKTVTHVFSIRFFFKQVKEFPNNKEATSDGDNWQNRSDPNRNSFGWFIRLRNRFKHRTSWRFSEWNLSERMIAKSFGEEKFSDGFPRDALPRRKRK